MAKLRLLAWVTLAMLVFAGNSLLCRLALKHTEIDPVSFTGIRLLSGAVMLWTVVMVRSAGTAVGHKNADLWRAGNWLSAAALFVYAAAFSWAYVDMTAATGALLLFGSVQASMIGYGIYQGERLRTWQWGGLALALAGLLVLLLPGLAAPSLGSALSMLAAGVAWGSYSLRGKRVKPSSGSDPILVTAGNFWRAAPMALAGSLVLWSHAHYDPMGAALAVASGAVASGLGYAIWYHALPSLQATHAATVQLSVPVIAALGGVLLLGEALTLPLLLASCAILGGIALVILGRKA